MPTFDWNAFLQQWSQDVLASTALSQTLPPAVGKVGWLGQPGATEGQITQAEARLNTTLPPSYRTFLQTSNGWYVNTDFVEQLLPVAEIEWLAERHPDLLQAWFAGYRLQGQPEPIPDESYLIYGKDQDPHLVRSEYLQTALAISDAGGGIYLLNPQVVSTNGEWEAWFFEPELGASRYRSFWELMQAEYQNLLLLIEEERKRLQPGDVPDTLAVKLPALIRELQQKSRQYVAMGQGTTANPLTTQYHQGIAEGLQFAETQVQEIQSQTRQPQELRRKLDLLANELQSRWQKGVQGIEQASGLEQIQPGDSAKLLASMRARAVSEGYRQAVGIIQWFLSEL